MERLTESIIGTSPDYCPGCLRAGLGRRCSTNSCRRVGKGALAPCPIDISVTHGGHASALPTLRINLRSRVHGLADLVLRLGVEITRLVALVKLAGGVARDTVDHAA